VPGSAQGSVGHPGGIGMRTGLRHPLDWRRAGAIAIAAIAVGFMPGLSDAHADVGHRDRAFGPDPNVVKPSGQKPQSKLWFHDGLWWGSLFEPGAGDNGEFHVERLNTVTHQWDDTGTALDDRNSSEADVLSVGSKLYVASSSDLTAGLRFYRYSYDAVQQKYTLDTGFPVPIGNNAGPVEAIVMDRDSTGRMWVTYTAPIDSTRTVYVAHTQNSDSDWTAPYQLPVPGADNLLAPTTPQSDDISAVVAFGTSIGVMWSNQADQKMYFAAHPDCGSDADWTRSTAYDQGPKSADDHINLKSLEADPAGRVFAAVKTSFGDDPSTFPSTSPQVNLLVRDPSGGWTPHLFGTVADDHTRPIVLTDQHTRTLYMLATSPTDPATGQQTIYYKTANLDNPVFAPDGLGLPFMQSDTAGININDVTSTKQDLSGAPGLVALASDASNYWHNTLPVGEAGSTAPRPVTTCPGPSTPPSPAAPNGPGPDVTKPALSSLSLRPASFHPAKRRSSTGGRLGTRVRFRLSERAKTSFRVEVRTLGRRVGGRCVRATRGNRSARPCIRYVVLAGSFAATGKAGANSLVFTGRLRGRALRAGRYRLVVTATDAAGNRSAPRRVAFRSAG
jgi:hypothetical protein